MPFTFSHPSIVLPLTYLPARFFSLTGLVIGSLTPDFEYFLRMKIQSNYSHTLAGLFWFDLPMGLLLTFIYHSIVRDGLFDNLPTFLKSRLLIYEKFDWNRYFNSNRIIVITSLLIGALSHILWDSFTHEHGYFVQEISMLTNTIDVGAKEIPVYKLVQHSSTLIGGLIIVISILKFPKEKIGTNRISFKYWSVLIIGTLLITSIRFLSGLDSRMYGNLIVTGISSLLISLILTPVITRETK